MSNITPIEYRGQRIITTKVLAQQFGTEENNIKKNHSNNKERFIEGKHFYKLEGAELAEFKRVVNISNDPSIKFARVLILWTERGVARHAKILETDEAWQVYEELEDTYFRVRYNEKIPRSYKQALLALVAAEEEKERLMLENSMKDQIISELQPKATYYDLILQSKSALPISQIAKDYGMSATKMNDLLHKMKIQYKQGDTWLLYQKHSAMGYTSSKTHHYINSAGEQCSKLHTYWTQKGRLFIYDLLKNREGIVPMMERDQAV